MCAWTSESRSEGHKNRFLCVQATQASKRQAPRGEAKQAALIPHTSLIGGSRRDSCSSQSLRLSENPAQPARAPHSFAEAETALPIGSARAPVLVHRQECSARTSPPWLRDHLERRTPRCRPSRSHWQWRCTPPLAALVMAAGPAAGAVGTAVAAAEVAAAEVDPCRAGPRLRWTQQEVQPRPG